MDKMLKLEVLKKLMDEIGGQTAESDLKPKTKMVIKAEGDSPEDVKQQVVDKLSNLDLPKEESMPMEEDKMPMEDMEEKDDMSEEDISGDSFMSDKMKELLLKKLRG